MDDHLQAQVERVHLATLAKGTRSLALTGVCAGMGTSGLAHAMARRAARGGGKVLLVCIDAAEGIVHNAFLPGDGQAISHSTAVADGFDMLKLSPPASSRDRWNDTSTLKRFFETELSNYAVIIADLPPIDRSRAQAIDPAIAAAACDAVIVVAMTGHTTDAALAACAQTLRECGAPLRGLVANDRMAPTMAAEIAWELARLRRLLPVVSSFLQAEQDFRGRFLSRRT